MNNIFKKSYKNNIWKLWGIMWSNQDHILFWVYVIYMISSWLTLTDISIIISSWLVVSSIWQIPWWIFADKFWYKTSILIGLILTVLWMSVFITVWWFIWFLVGYSINWFWSAMIGWADQALFYESMLKNKEEQHFKKVLWKVLFYIHMSALILCTLWWILYSYISPQTPFYIQIWINVIALFLAISLKWNSLITHQENTLNQLKKSFHYAFWRVNFSKIFIFSAIIWSISIITNQFLQPYYKSLEIDEKFFWAIASISFLFWWLGSLYSSKFWKIFSVDHYLVLHASVFTFLLLILQKITYVPVIVCIVFVLFFLRGLYTPTISTYINSKVDSNNRATMLSMNAQLLYIMASLSLFWIWYIADNQWITNAFFGIALLSMLFLIIYILSLREVKLEK